MTRVVHISFGLDVGGQEKLLIEFARHADRARFALTFVSLGSRGALADDLESQGWEVIALGKGRGLKPSLAYDLARLFRRIRPDVVHTHDNRALFYAGPAARLATVARMIHTRHGRNIDSTARQTAVGRCLSRLVDVFVCVSADARDQCLGEGVPGGKLMTISNGIDLDHFAFSGPQRGGPIICVARLSPEKDVANLVRAMAIVVREEPNCYAEIAGDGPCLPELSLLVSESGLDGRVFLLGAVRNIPELMARGAVYVLPSQSEGISLTLLEAMARGLPVAATRVGGTPEVVDDGESGWLVPAADSPALAGAILRLLSDRASARRMGRAGRAIVERSFDVRRMVDDYEALYCGRTQPLCGLADGRTVRDASGMSPGTE